MRKFCDEKTFNCNLLKYSHGVEKKNLMKFNLKK